MNKLLLSLQLILLTSQVLIICGQELTTSLPSPICNIDIKTGLNKTANATVREPLFLKGSGNAYQLMIPDENGNLVFKSGESALIACTTDTKTNNLLTFSEYQKIGKFLQLKK